MSNTRSFLRLVTDDAAASAPALGAASAPALGAASELTIEVFDHWSGDERSGPARMCTTMTRIDLAA